MTLQFQVSEPSSFRESGSVGPRADTAPAAQFAPAAEIVSRDAALMGGRVAVHLRPSSPAAAGAAARDAELMLTRMAAWAGRLTRFSATSDLMRLNADRHTIVPIRPTLATVLDWGRAAESATEGIVNIAMLDHRLAAESADTISTVSDRRVRAADAWSVERGARWTSVRRPPDLRFDLDGVGKGWIADRAIARLDGHAASVVDADGDIALRLGPGHAWSVAVEDPTNPGQHLATLRLEGEGHSAHTAFGIATSGRSVHRWTHGEHAGHHLIDPRTGRPAVTDVIQATVLAGSARHAEAYAKAAVILGSMAGLAALDRPGVHGVILVTEEGEILASPGTVRFLS